MGDDIEQYKTQIKGTAYSFRPFTADEISLIAELTYINASGGRYIKASMKLMEDASVEGQWEALSDRLVAREVKLEDLANAFKKLFERQVKTLEKSASSDEE